MTSPSWLRAAGFGLPSLIFIAVAVETTICAESAPPEILWQQSFGGSGDDTLNVVKPTSDGGFILGGYSNSGATGNKTNATHGDYDFWVVKVDESGHKLWDRSYGGNAEDKLYALEATGDGGYVLGGYSESGITGSKTSPNFGYRDFWVVKLDADGHQQWDKSFGGSGDNFSADVLYTLRVTSDGGFIIGGISESGMTGNKASTNWGSWDYWVLKLDASGDKQWEQTFGGAGSDYLYAIRTNSDGGYLLGGFSPPAISGNKTNAGYGTDWTDYWLVKLGPNGDKLWEATHGGTGYDYLYSFEPTIDGGYILGGTSSSPISGNKSNGGFGSADYWLVKVDENGSKQWDHCYGGNSDEELYSVLPTADGGYLLGGNSWSGASGNKTNSNYGNNDYWVIKASINGSKEWEKSLGGSSRDELHSLLATGDGGYLFAGNSASGVSGNKTTTGFGNYDFWLVKLGTPVLQPGFVSHGFDLNSTFQAQLQGLPGTNYIFQASTDLTNWTSVSTNSAVNGLVNFSDTETINFPVRFYRAVQSR